MGVMETNRAEKMFKTFWRVLKNFRSGARNPFETGERHVENSVDNVENLLENPVAGALWARFFPRRGVTALRRTPPPDKIAVKKIPSPYCQNRKGMVQYNKNCILNGGENAVNDTAIYRRVLLKLSGEALAGEKRSGLDFPLMKEVCTAVKRCADMGVEIGLVVGGGNFWRGAKDGGGKMERSRADHMGMLATVMNALALCDVFEQVGARACVMTMVDMPRFAEPYSRREAERRLKAGEIVIFACGTGSPFFSTDTGAVLKAAEIGAEAILLAKNVDGVYSADPLLDPEAVRYERVGYGEVLARRLGVMDLTATSLAMDNGVPVIVFALADPENIVRALRGEPVGTVVS